MFWWKLFIYFSQNSATGYVTGKLLAALIIKGQTTESWTHCSKIYWKMNALFWGMHCENLALKWHCHSQDTFRMKIKYLMEWYQQDLACKSTLFYVYFNGESVRINLQSCHAQLKFAQIELRILNWKAHQKSNFGWFWCN